MRSSEVIGEPEALFIKQLAWNLKSKVAALKDEITDHSRLKLSFPLRGEDEPLVVEINLREFKDKTVEEFYLSLINELVFVIENKANEVREEQQPRADNDN